MAIIRKEVTWGLLKLKPLLAPVFGTAISPLPGLGLSGDGVGVGVGVGSGVGVGVGVGVGSGPGVGPGVERSEYEKAEAEYRKMIEKYPEKQELYIELSSLYDQNNAFEMALETLFTAQMKSDGVTADTNLAKQEEIIREHMFYAEMEDNGFSKEMADRYMQMIKDGVDLSDMEDEEILELLKNREIPEEEFLHMKIII